MFGEPQSPVTPITDALKIVDRPRSNETTITKEDRPVQLSGTPMECCCDTFILDKTRYVTGGNQGTDGTSASST